MPTSPCAMITLRPEREPHEGRVTADVALAKLPRNRAYEYTVTMMTQDRIRVTH
jgi:hypothetical protein